VIATTVYYLLMLYYLVLYLKKQNFLYSCHEGIWGVIGGTTSLIHILITDELRGKLQAVAAVSLGKEPQGLA